MSLAAPSTDAAVITRQFPWIGPAGVIVISGSAARTGLKKAVKNKQRVPVIIRFIKVFYHGVKFS